MIVKVIEHVPDELPEGWDEEKLADHAAARLRVVAQQAGRRVTGALREVSRGPLPGMSGWNIVTWEQDTEALPLTLASTPVQAVPLDGTDAVEAYLPSSRTAIIAVRHPLDTTDVDVRAYGSAGQPINIIGASPITRGEVEVVVSPDTIRLVLTAQAEEGTDDRSA